MLVLLINDAVYWSGA